MRRYLVVANQTSGGEELTAKLAECIDAGPSRFYLVVPVTNTESSDRWFTGGLEGVLPGAYKIARTLAGGRLQHELDRLREAGAEADGEVVEPVPLDAIRKIASREEADEVIVSTLPRRMRDSNGAEGRTAYQIDHPAEHSSHLGTRVRAGR
jgi:hypothetical protein